MHQLCWLLFAIVFMGGTGYLVDRFVLLEKRISRSFNYFSPPSPMLMVNAEQINRFFLLKLPSLEQINISQMNFFPFFICVRFFCCTLVCSYNFNYPSVGDEKYLLWGGKIYEKKLRFEIVWINFFN